MARYMRNTTILAKVNASDYGTDAAPDGGANAILVSDCTITHIYDNVDRDLIRSFMGGSEQLVGTKHVSLEFTCELQGSGTAATAPAWGTLLRGCGFAVTTGLVTPARVECNPVSPGLEDITIYYYLDGVLHKALGCRGNVEIGAGIGERPTLKFSFLGVDGGVTVAYPSSVTYTAWKIPVVVTAANVASFLLGCTYATGAFSGGTAACSRGLSVNLGNDVQYIPTLCEGVDIVSRSATGTLSLDLDAAAEVAAMTAVEANTLTSIGMTIGSTTGYKVMIFCPYVQRTNPKYEEVNGRAHVSFDLRLVPGAAGNDEVRIILL